MHNRSMLITASADQSVRLWKPDPSLAPFQTKPPVQKKGTLAYPSLMIFFEIRQILFIYLLVYLFICLFIYLLLPEDMDKFNVEVFCGIHTHSTNQ